MTRPKKGESLIKTKGVHLRMSETEYEILSEKAIATNMSISDFIEKETPRREICLYNGVIWLGKIQWVFLVFSPGRA